MPLRPIAAAAILTLALCGAARAADCPAEPPPEAAVGVAEGRATPPEVTRPQKLALAGRCLEFHSTAGVVRIPDGEGKTRAEIAYIAYLLDGQDAAKRPVVFAINGGPGAGSVWLQLGAFGPWRLPMQDLTPSSPPTLAPMRRPGSTSPIWCSSIRRERATASRAIPRTPRRRTFGRSTATSTCWPKPSAAGSAITAGSPRQNSSSARATAASARRGSPRRWRAITGSACAA